MGFDILDWVVILLIVFVIFGAGKLPQAGDALGRAVRNFRKASSPTDNTIDVSPQAVGGGTADRPRLQPRQAPAVAVAAAAADDEPADDMQVPRLGARRARARDAIEDAVVTPDLTRRKKS
jgi:sec-independent protein translocase protein TatA